MLITPVPDGFPVKRSNTYGMKKQFPVIEVPASGERDWSGGAFTLTFVYSPKGNVLLKGYYDEVHQYIRKHFQRCFYRMVMYYKGSSRTLFFFSDECHLHIDTPRLHKRDYQPRYVVSPHNYNTNLDAIKLTFKRFPTRWIKEFDVLIDKYAKHHR
jgi:hypothetical protein